MKLHRVLGITQKTAWHWPIDIRETWAKKNLLPARSDETYIGGKEKNKAHKKQRSRMKSIVEVTSRPGCASVVQGTDHAHSKASIGPARRRCKGLHGSGGRVGMPFDHETSILGREYGISDTNGLSLSGHGLAPVSRDLPHISRTPSYVRNFRVSKPITVDQMAGIVRVGWQAAQVRPDCGVHGWHVSAPWKGDAIA